MKDDYKVYKYKRNPLLISAKSFYIIFLIVLVVWFVFQNLQALKIVATSLDPWILGLPFSLFMTWLLSLMVTIGVYIVAKNWGEGFAQRTEKEFGEEE